MGLFIITQEPKRSWRETYVIKVAVVDAATRGVALSKAFDLGFYIHKDTRPSFYKAVSINPYVIGKDVAL